jgi:2'-5' RNA ligase
VCAWAPSSRYNFASEVMSSSRYALVTYVRNPIGEFVENLRRELHPTTAHLEAHLTILPPRDLSGTEAAALEFLEEACSHVVPFEVELGAMKTFLPLTPTVYIEVKQAAAHMRELHDQLGVRGLRYEECWPYTPHLTILKASQDEQARAAYEVARERWSQYRGTRRVQVEELVFVRENEGCWSDLASVPLGRGQLSAK